jgi:hypothetical protein
MDALTVLRANKRFPLTNRLERSLRIPFFAIALLPAATSANGQQTHDARVADARSCRVPGAPAHGGSG